WMPCTIIAEIMRASVAEKGKPSTSTGTMLPIDAELFAASWPAIPSTAPVPSSLRYFDTDCSTLYDVKVDRGAAGAGSNPKTHATNEPRNHRGTDLPHSTLLGPRSRHRTLSGLRLGSLCPNM